MDLAQALLERNLSIKIVSIATKQVRIKVVFQDCGTGSGSFIFKYKLFEYTIINEFYRWTEKLLTHQEVLHFFLLQSANQMLHKKTFLD